MKSLSVKLGVILLIIGLIIFAYAEVWGADWTYYGETDHEKGYYDASSIVRPSRNIVRVWRKSVYSEKGVKHHVEKFGPRYETLSHAIGLWEINCAERKELLWEATAYANDGTVIITAERKGAENKWRFIVPESIGDLLYKAVCK